MESPRPAEFYEWQTKKLTDFLLFVLINSVTDRHIQLIRLSIDSEPAACNEPSHNRANDLELCV